MSCHTFLWHPHHDLHDILVSTRHVSHWKVSFVPITLLSTFQQLFDQVINMLFREKGSGLNMCFSYETPGVLITDRQM